MRNTRFVLLLLAGLGLLAPGVVAGQESACRHITASLGLLQYQLTRNGNAPMIAVRAATPVSSVLLLEVGFVGSRPQHELGGNSTFLAPEAQIQLALPFTGVVPYMGLGSGVILDFGGSDTGGAQTAFTISGSLGTRIWLGDQRGIQVEYRGRGIGTDFESSASEYAIGMAWRL